MWLDAAMKTFLLCLVLAAVNADRVLIVPMQFQSRRSEMALVGRELVSRGHQVHIIVPEGFAQHSEQMSSVGLHVETFTHPKDLMLMPSVEFDRWVGEKIFNESKEETLAAECVREFKDCVLMIEDSSMLERLEKLKFDLAFVDGMFLPPCYMAVAERLNLPYVIMFSVPVPWWMGLPALPSFTPAISVRTTDSMSLKEKLVSLFDLVLMHSPDVMGWLIGIDSDKVLRHVPHIKSWAVLYSKAELYIFTTDHHLDYPTLSLPNIIYLPGITLTKPQPLQGDISKIAEANPHGFIVVTFGSSSALLPAKIVGQFLTAFDRMKQTIIWKISQLPDDVSIPSNVVILPWIPQNDLLGHENARLFITHCGNNGQHESVYHGVPMVGFPLFLDQFHNADRMEAKGLGIQMDIKTFTADQLYDNVQEVIEKNTTFAANVRHLSKILHSRPALPKEEAADWLEHVLKFGSSHLKSVSQTMSTFQLFALDVVATVVVTMVIVFIMLYCTCRALLCKKRQKKKTD